MNELLKADFEELKKVASPKFYQILLHFFRCYENAISVPFSEVASILQMYLRFVREQIQHPFSFPIYHKKIRHPFDYYAFGLNFIRPLVDLVHSHIYGKEVLDWIAKKLQHKENCIFFANHQTETDPQAISLLLEQSHPQLADQIIYVAGERVTTDPLAIPVSMGCDLLCIYSRRYINYPPEKKTEKQQHNTQAMQTMSLLLQEGGKLIYVAPSGGRDRKNTAGKVEVAPFDPDSIEMFYLMAKKAKTPTHFIPMAMNTYELLPPPETTQTELGEKRRATHTPIAVALHPAFDMESFHGIANKHERREKRAAALWNLVNQMHEKL